MVFHHFWKLRFVARMLKKVQKMTPKWLPNSMKILKKWLQKGSEKNNTKTDATNHGKNRKWTPKWRPRGGHFLVIWLLFSVPGGLGSPNGSQGLSQQPPGSVQASISTDFGSILDDFLMIFCIMWATFYLACLITFLVTLSLHFQISGHKFKCVGVVRRGQ